MHLQRPAGTRIRSGTRPLRRCRSRVSLGRAASVPRESRTSETLRGLSSPARTARSDSVPGCRAAETATGRCLESREIWPCGTARCPKSGRLSSRRSDRKSDQRIRRGSPGIRRYPAITVQEETARQSSAQRLRRDSSSGTRAAASGSVSRRNV